MSKKNILLSTAVVALSFSIASFASAATHNNVSGTVCEGGVAPAGASGCNTGLALGDFNSDVANPTLNIVGDTRVWGGIAHRTTTQYQDNWTMNFGSDVYAATFNWQTVFANASGLFDADLTVGGVLYQFSTADAGSALGGSFSLGNLTGAVTFVFDSVAGNFGVNPDEVATWDLEVSQVPLPAAGFLLIAGLGGLGALRRKKRS